MLPVIPTKLSGPFLRTAAVMAQLVSLGALVTSCSSADPGARDKTTEKTTAAGEHVGEAREALAGVDNAVTVSTAGTVVNRYTALAASTTVNATSLQVASVAALAVGADALAAGDLVLVAQMQGAAINTTATDSHWGEVSAVNAAGLYEMAEVLGVNTTTNVITLSCTLKNVYSVTGATQVVRVPQYDTLTVATGASITAPAWDGTVGGIVAVDAKTTVTLTGDIDVTALGFRGGVTDDGSEAAGTNVTTYASAANTDGAHKGEGIAGVRAQYGRGPAANGGGGGNSHNAGGGGGANGKSGAAWTGQGTFNLAVTGGATAWLLDPNYDATASEGGGRGGYTYSDANLSALLFGPDIFLWGGNERRERGGLGGHPLDNDAATRVYLGGGGGAGDGNNGHAGRGGNGGGLVIVRAGSVTGAGRILANGEAGAVADSSTGSGSGDAPGGGGAGGAVVVRAATVSGFTVQALGGAGGKQTVNNGNEAEGPGGGGGGGFVSVSGTVGLTVAGGAGGTTTSSAVNEFPSNGATYGTAGLGQLGAAATGSIPYCADTTVPDTTIDTGPSGSVSSTTGTFTFSSPDATATFECRLDGGSFAACTTPLTTGVLAQGPHTLEVRAKDTVGNVDATPATRTWTVDTVAPDTTLLTGPSGTVTDTTGDFTFSSPDATATFECKIDGGAFVACTTPFSTPALADGSHTFTVRAKDLAGNVDATPATRTWTIDTAAPDTTITAGPSGTVNDSTADFTFTSTDATATFECRLDAGAFAACTTPLTTAVLADGAHTFEVRAKDPGGNVDATPATRTWTVDTAAPDTVLVLGPTGTVTDRTGDFTFTSPDATATFECNLDGGVFAACTTPLTTAALPDGPHTFAVRARDPVGNVDATPASRTWVVDATAPDTVLVTGPTGTVKDTTGDFTFSSPDPAATFECSLDSAAFATCATPLTTAVLTDGQHTFAVRARDIAGNTDATPATRTWTVDATGPDTTILTSPTSPTNDATGDFTFSSPEATATFQCSVDNAAFTTCTTPFTTAPLAAGTHDFRVRAVDTAGNVDATPAEVGWSISAADTDGDGISDTDETKLGTNPKDADTDDDGVIDGNEVDRDKDTDGDGLINALDPDSDDDGLFDGTELGKNCSNPATDVARGLCRPDANPATTTSPVNPDSDGGSVRDGSEDANLNGAVDPGEADPTSGHGGDDAAIKDTDGDGLSDALEATLRSNPADVDSDDDGVPDGQEPNPSADADGDQLVDVLDVDSDDDGLLDGTELGKTCTGAGTNAALGHCVADADPTTKTSAVNPDTDYGGVTDGNEDVNLNGAYASATETNPIAGKGADDGTLTGRDADGDGLSDALEATLGTDPHDADSDDDGLLDGLEPNPSDDQDGDNLTNALDPDSDGDGLFDGTEAGKDCANTATNVSKNHCVADADSGATVTAVLVRDTDHGGVVDGDEDTNANGKVDTGERDPLNPADDATGNGDGGVDGGITDGGAEAGADASNDAGPDGSAGSSGTGGTAAGGTTSGGATASGGATTGGSGNGGAANGGAATGGSETGGDESAGGESSSGGASAGGKASRDDGTLYGGGLDCSFSRKSAGGAWAGLFVAGLVLTARRRRQMARIRRH
jgi:hypothetical protein